MKLFVKETMKKFGMISRGDRIVCGVSGGADSVAMLRVLLELKDEMDFTVCVAHLNHMLRGDEAQRDADFVRDLCERFGVEFFYQETDVGALAQESGDSVELAARNVRYAFFQRVIEEYKGNKIATAHNAEDNLETVLMHLARGASLNGLGGIPPVRGNVIRPVVECTRHRIKEYLEKIDQGYVEDSTNAQRLYTRNRVRLDVLPILSELNPKVAECASQSSYMLREDEDYITSSAQEIVKTQIQKNGQISASVEFLEKLHPSLLRRVILLFAREAVKFTNYYLEFNHICDIINLMHSNSPSAMLNMPGGLVVARSYGSLIFRSNIESKKLESLELAPEMSFKNGDYEISCTCIAPEKGSFAIPFIEGESIITVRSRAQGDSIKLAGRPEKTLKKLFIDMKIPKGERDNIPVIDADGKVAAVYGIGTDERLSVADKEKILWVKIRRI